MDHVHNDILKRVHLNDEERFFDEEPAEPLLCTLRGYEDCENYYFRISTLNRIKQTEA